MIRRSFHSPLQTTCFGFSTTGRESSCDHGVVDARVGRRAKRFAGVFTLCLVVATMWLAGGALSAQQIKMATLSPENSPWDQIFKEMGKKWEEATSGRVSLVVYAGGVAGDEPDIIRKMRIGQYQAGALSVAGLVDIDKDFTVFEIPLFFADVPEMRHVLAALSPGLSTRLEEKGYVLLGWGYVGWVYFFSTAPVASLADMQNLKVFTWAGDETMIQWWRRNGFKPVALAATDILTGLETGMVQSVSMPPLYAMQMQYFKKAPFMQDVPLAPMMGAMLVSKRAWDKISAADQKVMKAAANQAQEQIFERIPKLDAMAIQLMTNQGMTVNKILDGPYAQDWLAAAKLFANDMRGTIVPTPIFDQAIAARDEFRQRNQKE